MIEALLVGIGGSLGAVSRYLVGTLVQPANERFPFDTLTVNVIGSFVLALITFLGAGSELVLVIGVGACGAFTTFSSFSVDTLRLWEDDYPVLATGYALANVVLATGAVLTAEILVGLH